MTTFESLAQADWLQTELDELTSSLEDFPVRTSASQEPEPACPVSAAASGPSFAELSLKFDPVGLSLRMSLGLELSALTQSSLTWQQQVTPLGRWWWVLSMPEVHKSEKECGLWRTPRTADHKGATKVSPRCLANPDMMNLPEQCNMLGRQDLAKSPGFREQLMGYPAGYTDVSD